MRLLNKDLRILSKERKEELLSSRCFLDISENQELLLVIDQNLPQSIQLELGKRNSSQIDPLSSGKLDEEMQEDDEEDEDVDDLASVQRDSLDTPVNRNMESDELQYAERNSLDPPKKKKKRKCLSFNSGARKYNCSKNMQTLPSFLADFSWLENTEANSKILA